MPPVPCACPHIIVARWPGQRRTRPRGRPRVAPTPGNAAAAVERRPAAVGHAPRPVGVRRCLTRPAREGRPTTTGVRRRSVLMINACRDATRMGRAVRRGRARQRLAPTTWGHIHGAARVRTGGRHRPRLVGVRRCLTRPARRAGHHAIAGRWCSMLHARAGVRATDCRAVRRGRARPRLAPTTWGNPSPVGQMGATVGRPRRPGRGQAVPDPSGPPGRRPIADAGQSGRATRCGARSQRAGRRALTPAAERR
jgi:hypothetical protein